MVRPLEVVLLVFMVLGITATAAQAVEALVSGVHQLVAALVEVSRLDQLFQIERALFPV
jgi:hypothetical protein